MQQRVHRMVWLGGAGCLLLLLGLLVVGMPRHRLTLVPLHPLSPPDAWMAVCAQQHEDGDFPVSLGQIQCRVTCLETQIRQITCVFSRQGGPVIPPSGA